MPRSASGSATTHAPAPSAVAIARRLIAYGARARGHLLDDYDGHEDPERHRERAGDRLRHREPCERRRQRARRGDDRACDRETEDESPPTLAVGHPSDDQREHDAATHDRERHALGAVARSELVGGERDRLGEQGVEVADDQRDRAEHPERCRAARVEPFRRRPPRHAVGVMAAQRAPRERREEESEVRHRERVLDRLDGAAPPSVSTTRRYAVNGPPSAANEPSSWRTSCDDVVARLEQARGRLGEAVDDAGHRLRCS